jgi:hypothetical protein
VNCSRRKPSVAVWPGWWNKARKEKSRLANLAKGDSFGFLGFEFRRVLSRKGKWRPNYAPKLKKRTALLAKLRDVFRRFVSQPVGRVIEVINPILRGWVNYFAVGHASECFSYIKNWVEKKIRRHLMRAAANRRSRRIQLYANTLTGMVTFRGSGTSGFGARLPCLASAGPPLLQRARTTTRKPRIERPIRTYGSTWKTVLLLRVPLGTSTCTEPVTAPAGTVVEIAVPVEFTVNEDGFHP